MKKILLMPAFILFLASLVFDLVIFSAKDANAASYGQPIVGGWGGLRISESQHFSSSNPPSEIFDGEQASNAEVEMKLFKNSGWNAVRIYFESPFTNGYPALSKRKEWSWNESWFNRTMQIAKALDLWAVVDYHAYYDHNETYKDKWITFWKENIISKYKDFYDKIIWEPINEPKTSKWPGDPAELQGPYQEWINMARSTGDSHWIAVSNAEWDGDWPVVSDPLNKIFINRHWYYNYEWNKDGYNKYFYDSNGAYKFTFVKCPWSTECAQSLADSMYGLITKAQEKFGRPYITTEMGTTIGAPDDINSSFSLVYSNSSFYFIQRLVNDFDGGADSDANRIGYFLWADGDWPKGVVGGNYYSLGKLLTYKNFSQTSLAFLNISGQLKDINGIPIQATILTGTKSTNTDSNGKYLLAVSQAVYDVQYNIPSFFIPNFFIKLISLNVTSDLSDLVNYVTGYPAENKISFTVNVTDNQTIQTYSPEKPKRVLINGPEITEVNALSDLKDDTWYYDSTSKILTIKLSSYEMALHKNGGMSWYGIDNVPEWYKMNKEFFNVMVATFPNMKLLSLPVSANKIMPKIENGDYTTINNTKLNLLRDFVSWSKSAGIKILISNHWRSLNEEATTAYWKFMAKEFSGEETISGFVLISEPWGISGANESLIQSYERMIDSIRAIDPTRTCYVESYLPHEEGMGWVRTNPVKRSNVVYVAHLYSNNWETGEWYRWPYGTPWTQYYLAHNYTKAKQVLMYGDGVGRGLYQRFGFIKKELGVPVTINELAFLSSEEGLTYGTDVLNILNEWGIDWAYHSWYTSADRPMCLTYPNGTLRPQATIVQDNLNLLS